MRIAALRRNAETVLAVVHGEVLVDVEALAEGNSENPAGFSLREFYSVGNRALDRLRTLLRTTHSPSSAIRPLEGALFAAPVPAPGKIICIGLNYARHAAESGMDIPNVPVVFSKFNNSLCGPGDPIPLPAATTEADYEVELAVIIGDRAKDIDVASALDYVLGYATANDMSARDLQFKTSQWLLGKTLDAFLPMGPYVVTADEIGDPQDLWLRSWVNGQPRQDSTTADMVFSVAQIIEYLSHHMTLEPGDVILTGTPEGVALGSDHPWLTVEDIVAVEVAGLGRCENKLIL